MKSLTVRTTSPINGNDLLLVTNAVFNLTGAHCDSYATERQDVGITEFKLTFEKMNRDKLNFVMGILQGFFVGRQLGGLSIF